MAEYPTALAVIEDPTQLSLEQAQQQPDWPHWQRAAQAEVRGLEERGTWQRVHEDEVPSGEQILNSRILLKLKVDADGAPVKYKARLVVIGCAERRDQDEANFAPVAHIHTVRTLLSVAAAQGLQLAVSDIGQAYTEAPVRKATYVRPPESSPEFKEGEVLLLKRNLYGLRSGAIQFYHTLKDFLIGLGFTRAHHDPCLFVQTDEQGQRLYVLTYVDDILSAGPPHLIDAFKTALGERFKVTHQPHANEYLGFKLVRHENGAIGVSQPHKIQHTLDVFGNMQDATPAQTPLPVEKPDEHDEKCNDEDTARYRRCNGSLLHIASTYRADIAFAVSQLCKRNSEPCNSDLRRLHHLLRYLKGTAQQQLLLGSNADLFMTAYSDADWGGCPSTGRSTSGLVVRLAGGTICYSSSLQATVSTSTCQSELVALSSAAKLVVHMRELLQEMGVPQRQPTVIFSDNQASIHVAKAIGSTAKTRHARVTDFYIQELVQTRQIVVRHIAGRQMISDGLTKLLSGPATLKLRQAVLGSSE
jgi:hypothetical protein